MICLKVTIEGKVQGVFFRKEAKKVADVLGVYGTVRNNADGSVELVAFGDREIVYKLIDYCHHGPELARVDKVSVKQIDGEMYEVFEILE
jgi:acylphosphatase